MDGGRRDFRGTYRVPQEGPVRTRGYNRDERGYARDDHEYWEHDERYDRYDGRYAPYRDYDGQPTGDGRMVATTAIKWGGIVLVALIVAVVAVMLLNSPGSVGSLGMEQVAQPSQPVQSAPIQQEAPQVSQVPDPASSGQIEGMRASFERQITDLQQQITELRIWLESQLSQIPGVEATPGSEGSGAAG